ncbi:hypothetical protein C8Q80DRAFT_1124114 [Daedaleopsis nitida]|nr:hypothetical protein C8Q80DRAFT_1124114 [Daedaleopsis nitida]
MCPCARRSGRAVATRRMLMTSVVALAPHSGLRVAHPGSSRMLYRINAAIHTDRMYGMSQSVPVGPCNWFEYGSRTGYHRQQPSGGTTQGIALAAVMFVLAVLPCPEAGSTSVVPSRSHVVNDRAYYLIDKAWPAAHSSLAYVHTYRLAKDSASRRHSRCSPYTSPEVLGGEENKLPDSTSTGCSEALGHDIDRKNHRDGA